ncbi:unnamed protein product [Urochloa decumbens]|uniref:Peroxidase n=1 Tax=Urochloa decumbens TaxID=240449 RepID=A0ABC8XEI8_9POAL
MASSTPRAATVAGVLVTVVAALYGLHGAAAQLCENYYAETCPDAYDIVKKVLIEAHQSDERIYASLIRLHFHDCFVQGCDGSLLLDSVPGMQSEKDSLPNKGSARGFPVVDAVKEALEAACPGVVSCADILAIASEISVVERTNAWTCRWLLYTHANYIDHPYPSGYFTLLLSSTATGPAGSITNSPPCCRTTRPWLPSGNNTAGLSSGNSGGPSWGVLLGRLDGKTSDFTGSGNLPAPFEDLATLQRKFRAVGLNGDVDLVALSGAHTFGRVQCANVADPPADRLYNFSGTNMPDPTMDSAYRAFLSQRCPRNGDSRVLNDLDPTTPDTFDNHYYTNIEVNRGFLTSDQELKSSPLAQGTTAPIVDQFASSQDAFFASFAQSMINMGNIRPVTDPSQGEVRKNCRRVN